MWLFVAHTMHDCPGDTKRNSPSLCTPSREKTHAIGGLWMPASRIPSWSYFMLYGEMQQHRQDSESDSDFVCILERIIKPTGRSQQKIGAFEEVLLELWHMTRVWSRIAIRVGLWSFDKENVNVIVLVLMSRVAMCILYVILYYVMLHNYIILCALCNYIIL